MLFIMFVPGWLSQVKDRIFLYIIHLFYSNKLYKGAPPQTVFGSSHPLGLGANEEPKCEAKSASAESLHNLI